jgi:hypothetical protein
LCGSVVFFQQMSVTFDKRMGKSWSVTLHGKKFKEGGHGGPHVETTEEGLAGKTFSLGAREVRGNAVMYVVNGVKNGAHAAHITVFYGDAAEHSQY